MPTAPGGPTPEERAARELLHVVPVPWCEFCVWGNSTSKPHQKLIYDQKDIGKGKVILDFCYLKADGEWTQAFDPEPPAAEVFAITLVMVDSDTLMMRAAFMLTKATTEYATQSVLTFLDSLNLERTVLLTDGEPAIKAIVGAVKTSVKNRRKKPTDLEEGSLKDSSNMGGAASPIRWFQAKMKTYKYDLEARYKVVLTADSHMWCWLIRYAAWVMSTYRVCEQMGILHTGQLLATATQVKFYPLEQQPCSRSRFRTQGRSFFRLQNKGESVFVRGIWVGKHAESDDHVFLAPQGWHRARTVRRLEPKKRASLVLLSRTAALP